MIQDIKSLVIKLILPWADHRRQEYIALPASAAETLVYPGADVSGDRT